ncbi:MAG: serine hydrolase, partial [Bacteroidales bacterium]|nr:serine hydrolase [Bacteroidales bacterium]
MKFIKITLTILLVVFTYNLRAQQFLTLDKKILSLRKQAHQSICLLKNENNLIPIKNLNQNIACLSIGCDTINTFQNRISDYSLVPHFNIRKTESAATLQQLKNKLKKFNLVIVSFHNLHESPRKAYGITAQMDELFKFAVDSLPSIIAIFGTTNSLNIFNGATEAKTLLISSADSIEYQDFAAQIIFGGMPAIGKLKIDENGSFKNGGGLQTKEVIRFSYQLPEELGLNSEFLNTKIDSIANKGIEKGAFPGCQILAAKNGAIFFHKTYGFHTFDSITSVKKSDLYDFASVTKITGPLPALMKLYDEGKFNLDTSFASYWPDFKHSNKKEIIVREVLAHQAQLQPYIAFWKNAYKKNGKFRFHTFKPDST